MSSGSDGMRAVNILDVNIDPVSELEALNKVADFIAAKKPHQVATINAEFIVEAQKNSQFRKVLNDADLALADSSAVVWAARFLGSFLPERIPGADFVNLLALQAEEQGWRLYLIGGAAGVAEEAGKALKKIHPGLQVVGAEAGLERGSHLDIAAQTEALVNRIKNAKPDILLVAFGAPKQDLFIADNKDELGVPVMIGVGGTLDFLAGRVKRAPEIWRQLALEWLWRLLNDPRRMPRIYRAVVKFPWLVISSKFR